MTNYYFYEAHSVKVYDDSLYTHLVFESRWILDIPNPLRNVIKCKWGKR